MQQSSLATSPTYQLPPVEVHAGQFAIVWLGNVDVEGLTLVNEGAAVCCHLEDGLLGDFPHCFVQLFQIIWDLCDTLWKSEMSKMLNHQIR